MKIKCREKIDYTFEEFAIKENAKLIASGAGLFIKMRYIRPCVYADENNLAKRGKRMIQKRKG